LVYYYPAMSLQGPVWLSNVSFNSFISRLGLFLFNHLGRCTFLILAELSRVMEAISSSDSRLGMSPNAFMQKRKKGASLDIVNKFLALIYWYQYLPTTRGNVFGQVALSLRNWDEVTVEIWTLTTEP